MSLDHNINPVEIVQALEFIDQVASNTHNWKLLNSKASQKKYQQVLNMVPENKGITWHIWSRSCKWGSRRCKCDSSKWCMPSDQELPKVIFSMSVESDTHFSETNSSESENSAKITYDDFSDECDELQQFV